MWLNSAIRCFALLVVWALVSSCTHVPHAPDQHEAVNAAGDTRLHEAAYLGEYDSVVHCLAAGADLNAQNYIGETPLHLAAERGHLSIVGLLIRRGARLDIVTNEENPASVLDYSLTLEIYMYIRNAGGRSTRKNRSDM